MHADRRRWGRGLGGAALAVVLAASGASAEEMYGNAQVQFQRVEDGTEFVQPDGRTGFRRFSREFWLQTYDFNHRAYPRENVLLQSTLRFSRLSFSRSSDFSQSPEGSFRLVHPWVNFSASHEPTSSRTSRRPFAESAGPTSTSLLTRSRESQVVANLSRPGWPQVGVSFLRRARDASEGNPGETNWNRSARVNYTRETWSTYGSVVEQRSQRDGVNPVPLRQRVAALGGSVRVTPAREFTAGLQFDLADTRSGFVGQRQAGTRTSAIDLQSEWRPRSNWSNSVSGVYRRTRTTQLASRDLNDWETNALSSWQPTRHARLSAGAGARSVHLFNREADLRYVTVVAAGDARVRRGWQVNGVATSTVNWDPERGRYAAQTLGGSSRMDANRRMRFDANYQLALNGDTAAAPQRLAVTWSGRAQLQPLRSLLLSGTLASFRVGRGFLSPSGVSRSRSAEVRWSPMPRLDLGGSVASTGLLPNDAPRTVTHTATLRATPAPQFQFTGQWSRSSQERSSTESSSLRGRELASGRLQWTISRRLAATGGISVAGPGTTREVRLYDAVMTWSFGR